VQRLGELCLLSEPLDVQFNDFCDRAGKALDGMCHRFAPVLVFIFQWLNQWLLYLPQHIRH
jgi:hypothetical protein